MAAASTPAPPAAGTSADPPPAPGDPGAGPPAADIHALPGTGSKMALTIDDGTDTEVVGAYIEFIKASGIRLTFFPNGLRPSWTDHAAELRPLVDSGQVQLGNHTWSHPDLRTLTDSGIVRELTTNEQFLNNTYGVTAKPFVRPPYGFHNPRVDAAAASIGYTTMVLWYGSLGDSAVLTPDVVLQQAQQWFGAQRIVIGHANHPAVTQIYPQLLELIRERSLRTVTLDDAFYGAAGRGRTLYPH